MSASIRTGLFPRTFSWSLHVLNAHWGNGVKAHTRDNLPPADTHCSQLDITCRGGNYVSHMTDHTYLLTYSMVQSPSWEANWFAASQEIPRISWNPKVHYHTHKRPPPIPILGQPNPVHIPTSHLLEIHPNIIHPSTPRSPQWSLSTKTLYTPLSSPIRATCPAHLILLDFITRTILGEEYRSLSPSLCSLLYSPVTSSLLGPKHDRPCSRKLT